MTVDITNENYKELFQNSSKPIVLDFWAPSCGPCMILNPILEELALEYKQEVIIGKVNANLNMEIANQFGVRGLPTILFFKNGDVVGKHIGATSKKILENKLILNLIE